MRATASEIKCPSCGQYWYSDRPAVADVPRLRVPRPRKYTGDSTRNLIFWAIHRWPLLFGLAGLACIAAFFAVVKPWGTA